jgi:hypothetical protein
MFIAFDATSSWFEWKFDFVVCAMIWSVIV